MYCSYTLHVFFFNDTATTEIYTLSLHDALPIYGEYWGKVLQPMKVITLWLGVDASTRENGCMRVIPGSHREVAAGMERRSEEHTSELQSRQYIVCRLLLEKKKNKSHRLQSYMTH